MFLPYLGFLELLPSFSCFSCVTTKSLCLLVGPPRTCRNVFQVAFVPSKVGCPGSNTVFQDLPQWNCLPLVGRREKEPRDTWGWGGGGGFLLLPHPCLGLLEEYFCRFAWGPGGAVVLCLGAHKKSTVHDADTGERDQHRGCP